MPPKPKEVPNPTTIDIPPGLVLIVGPDGKRYIVPQFLKPDLSCSTLAYRTKQELDVLSAEARLVNVDPDIETESVAGLMTYPANPVLSDQERISVHSEILALRERLGISYKDASHRLYMAELEKLKTINGHCKALANLSACIQESLQNIDADNANKGKQKEMNDES